jgi:hypothetical protein
MFRSFSFLSRVFDLMQFCDGSDKGTASYFMQILSVHKASVRERKHEQYTETKHSSIWNTIVKLFLKHCITSESHIEP